MANKKSKVTPKISLKNVLVIFIILALVTGVAIQVRINQFQNQRIDGLYTWQFKTLITDSWEGLYRISDKVEDDGLIREANIRIDQSGLEANDEIFYIYDQEDSRLQINSFFILGYAKNASINISDMDSLMASVPEAQACVRGFSVFIDKTIEDEGLTLVSEKNLADGRKANIYRENSCNAFNIDNLETVIKTIESN